MHQIENLLRLGKKTNLWLRIDEFNLNLYIRVTQRRLNGRIESTIDLASIEVDFRYQCQGYFTAFLTEIEKLAVKYNRHVYVETILRDFLFKSLLKRGYEIMTPDERSLAKLF